MELNQPFQLINKEINVVESDIFNIEELVKEEIDNQKVFDPSYLNELEGKIKKTKLRIENLVKEQKDLEEYAKAALKAGDKAKAVEFLKEKKKITEQMKSQEGLLEMMEHEKYKIENEKYMADATNILDRAKNELKEPNVYNELEKKIKETKLRIKNLENEQKDLEEYAKAALKAGDKTKAVEFLKEKKKITEQMKSQEALLEMMERQKCKIEKDELDDFLFRCAEGKDLLDKMERQKCKIEKDELDDFLFRCAEGKPIQQEIKHEIKIEEPAQQKIKQEIINTEKKDEENKLNKEFLKRKRGRLCKEENNEGRNMKLEIHLKIE